MKELSFSRSVAIVSVSLVLFVFFACLTPYVGQAGPINEALFGQSRLDRGEKIIKDLESLNPGQIVAFVLPFLYEGEYRKRDLIWIQDFTKDLRKTFPDFSITSLSNTPRYRSMGNTVSVFPYVHPSLLQDFDSEKWIREVRRDEKVGGLLLSRNATFTTVVMALPSDADEMDVQHQVIEFLEGHAIPWWGWYFKQDIMLAHKFIRTHDMAVPERFRVDQSEHARPDGSIRAVLPAGWGLGRVFLTGGFFASLFSILLLSIPLAFLALWLSLESWKQAILGLSVIGMGVVGTNGFVALLQLLDFQVHGSEMYQTVYFTLVLAGLVVPGISAVDRMFDSYNGTRVIHSSTTRSEAWRLSMANPLTRVNERLVFVTIITATSFLLVYFIGIRQAFGVGLFSAIGMVLLLLLSVYYLPAVHILFGGESCRGWLSEKWHWLLDYLVEYCYRLVCPKGDQSLPTYKKRASGVLMAVAGLVFLVSGILVSGYIIPGLEPFIKIQTEPLTFIEDTLVYESAMELNKPGNYGFDRTMFVVGKKPNSLTKGVPAIYDPLFWEKISSLEKRIESDPEISEYVRHAHSAVDIFMVQSREDYGVRIAETPMFAADAVRAVATSLGALRRRQLWSFSGEAIVLFVSLPASNSSHMKIVIDRVLEVASNDFPSLEADPFGKFALFAWVDGQLRRAIIPDSAFQIFSIFLFTLFWVLWRHRRFRLGQDGGYSLSPCFAGFVITLPFFFALAMMTIVIMIFNVPLDQSTALIIPLTVAAAIDFSLYVVGDYQAELLTGNDHRSALRYALRERGHIVLIDGIVNATIFFPIGLLASFAPVSRIGWMLVVMLVFCTIGALIILPAALPLAVREKKREFISERIRVPLLRV